MNRQQILKVLQALKPYINSESFVCCAATRARRYGWITHEDEQAFIDFIHERLEGSYTVTSWLESKGFITEGVKWEHKLDYRHRWVDAMIAEMSAG